MPVGLALFAVGLVVGVVGYSIGGGGVGPTLFLIGIVAGGAWFGCAWQGHRKDWP